MRCPDCDSPSPRLHPAVQCEGEVAYICQNEFHGKYRSIESHKKESIQQRSAK